MLHGHTSIYQPWGRITDAVAENEALMRDDAMTLPVETPSEARAARLREGKELVAMDYKECVIDKREAHSMV